MTPRLFTEDVCYRHLARRMIAQLLIDAADPAFSASILHFLEESDFSAWCHIAELDEDDVRAKARYLIYHDEHGAPRKLTLLQEYLLTAESQHLLQAGRPFSLFSEAFSAWAKERGVSVRLATHSIPGILHQYGLDVAGGGKAATFVEW